MFTSDDRDAAIEKALGGHLPALVGVLGAKDYLIGANVTYVDFVLFEGIESVLKICKDERIFDKYPTLRSFKARMLKLPKFGAWYSSEACQKANFFPHFIKVKL